MTIFSDEPRFSLSSSPNLLSGIGTIQLGMILSCLALVKDVAGLQIFLNALILIVASLQIVSGGLRAVTTPIVLLAIIASLGVFSIGGSLYQYAQCIFLLIIPFFVTFLSRVDRSLISRYLASVGLSAFAVVLVLEVFLGESDRYRTAASMLNFLPGLDLYSLKSVLIPRLAGPSGDPNFSAVVASLMALIFIMNRQKFAFYAACAFLLLMVSRGGIIALIIGLVAFFGPILLSRMLAITSFLVLMLLPLIVHFLAVTLPSTTVVKLIIISSKRFLHWMHYVEFGISHPFLGIGYFEGQKYYGNTVSNFSFGGENFGRVTGLYQEAHNFTLDLWAELGIVAWLVVITFLGLILRRAWSDRQGLAVFSLLMVSYMFLSGLSDWAFWFGIGYILARYHQIIYRH